MIEQIGLGSFSLRKGLMAILLAGVFGFLAVPASASAQDWVPPNETAVAEADDNTILEYDGAWVECDLSGATAVTGSSGGGSITDLWFGPNPSSDCQASLGDVESITVDGLPWNAPATAALGGGDGTADIELANGSDGVTVEITVFGLPACTLDVLGPQAIGANWDASAQALTVGNARPTPDPGNVFVEASGTLCPLASSGPGTYTGTYDRIDQDAAPDIEIQ